MCTAATHEPRVSRKKERERPSTTSIERRVSILPVSSLFHGKRRQSEGKKGNKSIRVRKTEHANGSCTKKLSMPLRWEEGVSFLLFGRTLCFVTPFSRSWKIRVWGSRVSTHDRLPLLFPSNSLASLWCQILACPCTHPDVLPLIGSWTAGKFSDLSKGRHE